MIVYTLIRIRSIYTPNDVFLLVLCERLADSDCTRRLHQDVLIGKYGQKRSLDMQELRLNRCLITHLLRNKAL